MLLTSEYRKVRDLIMEYNINCNVTKFNVRRDATEILSDEYFGLTWVRSTA